MQLYDRIDKAGYTLDRIGFSFDQNMGYPSALRDTMPRGACRILRQPFAYRATDLDDDIHVTEETIKAVVMVGRQHHPATVQSNLMQGLAEAGIETDRLHRLDGCARIRKDAD